MKTLSILSRVTLCALVLGTCGMTTTFAQTPPPTPAPSSGGSSTALTADERAEYMKARDAVFAANPDLKKQADDLKAQMSGASKEDRKALRPKMTEFETQKLRPEMLKIDPNLGPIFTKMDAARAARRAASGN